MLSLLKVKYVKVIILLALIGSFTLTACTTQADRENPVLSKVTRENLWQPIPTAVGYSSIDLQLIILRRQEVINQKLDQLLQELKQ